MARASEAFSPAGEHVKVGAGGHGEGAGLLLRQAARGGAAVPRTGQRRPEAGGAADDDPLRGGRAGRSTSGTGLVFQSREGGRVELEVEVGGAGRASVAAVMSCVVRPRKTSVFMLSHVTLLRFAEAFMAQFSTFDVQEGAELAEGNGEEAEQQPQEEGGDDQQEEQDEY